MNLQATSDGQCSETSPDYVEVRNGAKEDSPLLWRGCGTSEPPTIRSQSNRLWIGMVIEKLKDKKCYHKPL